MGVPGCPAQKRSCCETSGYPPCPVLTDVPLYRDIPSGHHFNKTWFVKHTLFPPIEIGRGYIPWYVGSATHLSSRPMSSLLLAGKPESRFETQNFGSIVNQGTYTYAGNYTKLRIYTYPGMWRVWQKTMFRNIGMSRCSVIPSGMSRMSRIPRRDMVSSLVATMG